MWNALISHVIYQIKGLVNASDGIKGIYPEAFKGRRGQHFAHKLSQHQYTPAPVCIRPFVFWQTHNLIPSRLRQSIGEGSLLQVALETFPRPSVKLAHHLRLSGR